MIRIILCSLCIISIAHAQDDLGDPLDGGDTLIEEAPKIAPVPKITKPKLLPICKKRELRNPWIKTKLETVCEVNVSSDCFCKENK